MSTFSGLSTAASGLAAARRGMDVVGQNIANQTTDGYTRQRVSTHAVAALQAGRIGRGALPGQGVAVDGISRLGDALLDALGSPDDGRTAAVPLPAKRGRAADAA